MNRSQWESDESKPTRRRRDPLKRQDPDRLPRPRRNRPPYDEEEFEFEDDFAPDSEEEDGDWDEASDDDLDGLLDGIDDDEFYHDEDDF